MSIVILSLGPDQGSATAAQVKHGENRFTALVHGKRSALVELIDQDCLAEMSFERVASWRSFDEFNDQDSAICASPSIPGATVVCGRVHCITDVDQCSKVIDLYLQNGPEFLAVESGEIGGKAPPVGSGLEVTVHGLCFYPRDT